MEKYHVIEVYYKYGEMIHNEYSEQELILNAKDAIEFTRELGKKYQKYHFYLSLKDENIDINRLIKDMISMGKQLVVDEEGWGWKCVIKGGKTIYCYNG